MSKTQRGLFTITKTGPAPGKQLPRTGLDLRLPVPDLISRAPIPSQGVSLEGVRHWGKRGCRQVLYKEEKTGSPFRGGTAALEMDPGAAYHVGLPSRPRAPALGSQLGRGFSCQKCAHAHTPGALPGTGGRRGTQYILILGHSAAIFPSSHVYKAASSSIIK